VACSSREPRRHGGPSACALAEGRASQVASQPKRQPAAVRA
jgi:hypothetical protein